VTSMVRSAELVLTGGSDPDATVRTLLELDAIEPWTVEYVRMRALRDRAIESLGADPLPPLLIAPAEAWRPWRAYAAMLLSQHRVA
jgi:AraC family transcriptional regulator of adaptative response / DNA-3-methyladenine glycosylase II